MMGGCQRITYIYGCATGNHSPYLASGAWLNRAEGDTSMASDRLPDAAARLAAAVTRRQSAALLGALGIASTGLAESADAKKKNKKKKKSNTATTQPPTTSRGTTTTTQPGPEVVYTCAASSGVQSIETSPDLTDYRVAQTFMPERLGSLRRIEFRTNNPYDQDGDFVVELLATNGVIPMHLPEHVLASATIPKADVPLGALVPVVANFNGPMLKRETVYAAALSRRSASGALRIFGFAFRTDNRCSGKAFIAAGYAFSPLTTNADDVTADLIVDVSIE